jgi:hypothetical protein
MTFIPLLSLAQYFLFIVIIHIYFNTDYMESNTCIVLSLVSTLIKLVSCIYMTTAWWYTNRTGLCITVKSIISSFSNPLLWYEVRFSSVAACINSKMLLVSWISYQDPDICKIWVARINMFYLSYKHKIPTIDLLNFCEVIINFTGSACHIRLVENMHKY